MENILLKYSTGIVLCFSKNTYSIEMCNLSIYLVTRNLVLLLTKPKGFDFFPLICCEKAETFFTINVKRASTHVRIKLKKLLVY